MEASYGQSVGSLPVKRRRVAYGEREVIDDGARRFPRGSDTHRLLLHSCLWCQDGDLMWDVADEEWFCMQCGWREFELTRAERPVVEVDEEPRYAPDLLM